MFEVKLQVESTQNNKEVENSDLVVCEIVINKESCYFLTKGNIPTDAEYYKILIETPILDKVKKYYW